MTSFFFSRTRQPQLEALLRDAMTGIAADIAADPAAAAAVRAVVLGGGYGRGEGGATPEGRPYNDLDFFVILQSKAPAGFFDELSRKWHETLGIDVDFFLVDSLEQLYRNGDTLMMQELFAGYRVIYGDEEIFAAAPRRPFEELPWQEGARLLLNRGTGLLLCREKIRHRRDADFVRRNLHKAVLGDGDALLIAAGRYRRTGPERQAELATLFPADPLPAAYAAALQFKYQPEAEAENDFQLLTLHWLDECRRFLETLCRFSAAVSGRQRREAGQAARELARSGRESRARGLKNALLSLRYLWQYPAILFPLRTHPRIKLLVLLAKKLPENPSYPDGYLALWKRFN